MVRDATCRSYSQYMVGTAVHVQQLLASVYAKATRVRYAHIPTEEALGVAVQVERPQTAGVTSVGVSCAGDDHPHVRPPSQRLALVDARADTTAKSPHMTVKRPAISMVVGGRPRTGHASSA